MAVVAQLGFKRVHALKPIRVLALPKYGPLGSASRLRFLQYFAPLQAVGLVIEQSSLLSDYALRSRYKTGDYSHLQLIQSYASRIKVLLMKGRFDLLWIEKEALPWFPLWLEIAMLSGYLLSLITMMQSFTIMIITLQNGYVSCTGNALTA